LFQVNVYSQGTWLSQDMQCNSDNYLEK
jgi:hypothetical protein